MLARLGRGINLHPDLVSYIVYHCGLHNNRAIISNVTLRQFIPQVYGSKACIATVSSLFSY